MTKENYKKAKELHDKKERSTEACKALLDRIDSFNTTSEEKKEYEN